MYNWGPPHGCDLVVYSYPSVGSSTIASGNNNQIINDSYYFDHLSYNRTPVDSNYNTILNGQFNVSKNLVTASPTTTNCYTLIGNGCCNTVNMPYSSIINGSNNKANGSYSFIAGGVNNYDNGCSNVFILGSNITANQNNTTYVEKLNVKTTISIANATGSAGGTTRTNSFPIYNASGSLLGYVPIYT